MGVTGSLGKGAGEQGGPYLYYKAAVVRNDDLRNILFNF